MYNNIVYIGIAGRRETQKDKEGKKMYCQQTHIISGMGIAKMK